MDYALVNHIDHTIRNNLISETGRRILRFVDEKTIILTQRKDKWNLRRFISILNNDENIKSAAQYGIISEKNDYKNDYKDKTWNHVPIMDAIFEACPIFLNTHKDALPKKTADWVYYIFNHNFIKNHAR